MLSISSWLLSTKLIDTPSPYSHGTIYGPSQGCIHGIRLTFRPSSDLWIIVNNIWSVASDKDGDFGFVYFWKMDTIKVRPPSQFSVVGKVLLSNREAFSLVEGELCLSI